MAAPKKNKDGLLGGQLVSPKDHQKVMVKKAKERAKPVIEVKPEEV